VSNGISNIILYQKSNECCIILLIAILYMGSSLSRLQKSKDKIRLKRDSIPKEKDLMEEKT
jgi:hypothetical protein